MPRTILLYGADEFIGRLVALQPIWQQPGAPHLV